MTDEEFQKIVIQMLDQLIKGQSNLAKVESLQKEVQNMHRNLRAIEEVTVDTWREM